MTAGPSGPAIVAARDLPASALDAAAQFHASLVPLVREQAQEHPLVVIDFAAADHSNASWRQAVVGQLARELAPVRVNAIASQTEAQEARARALEYLARAPGVTGQVLCLDGNR
ncbi:Rossmann fold domain-containing protein [Aurantiacibacter flavus]|uniref:Rossmann fold domain-containing protein n=1 Tax=Aurantiacibacter flavus TaxID=3145232 RepID=A0ABV0CT03_9SPHN